MKAVHVAPPLVEPYTTWILVAESLMPAKVTYTVLPLGIVGVDGDAGDVEAVGVQCGRRWRRRFRVRSCHTGTALEDGIEGWRSKRGRAEVRTVAGRAIHAEIDNLAAGGRGHGSHGADERVAIAGDGGGSPEGRTGLMALAEVQPERGAGPRHTRQVATSNCVSSTGSTRKVAGRGMA